MAVRHAKPDPDQLGLDFTSSFDERMACFRLQVDRLSVEELEVSERQLMILREVLKAIFCFCGADREVDCTAADHELAAGCEVDHSTISLPTFRNHRTLLRQVGLVKVRPRWQGKRRLPSAWSIVWDRFDELAACSENLGITRNSSEQLGIARKTIRNPQPSNLNPQSSPPTPSASAAESPNRSNACSTATPVADAQCPADATTVREAPPPRPSPQGGVSDSPVLPKATPDRPKTITGWVGWFVEELKVDPRNVRNTLRAFRDVEGTSDVLAEIVQVYRERPGAWGPGALLTRIQRWRPGDNPAASWPPPDLEAEKRESMKAAAARRPQELAEQDRKRREVKRRRQQIKADHDELAAAWSSLSDTEREELLDQHRPDWRALSFNDTGSTLMATMVPREAIERLASVSV